MIAAPTIRIRPARADDEAAIETVAMANDESILWPGLPRSPYLAHMLACASRTVGKFPDRATQAGVIVRHASVHWQAGEHGERTKRPFAPSGRGG